MWNSPLDESEVCRLIDEMVAQHVYGAHLFPWSGMRPSYLTPEWWSVVRAAAEHAAAVGFELGFVDEFNYPSGEARDFLLPGIPSRVLDADATFRMKSLRLQRVGPSASADDDRVDGAGVTFAVRGSVDHSKRVRRESLTDVTDRVTAGSLSGLGEDEVLWLFRLEETVGMDGGLVDLLNPDAVKVFIDTVYGGYLEEVGDFGRGIVRAFIDHEGDYGRRLAWTPRLLEEFQSRNGYDLVPLLPLLIEDDETWSVKVRCDYFDVVSDLYAESFFAQITAWCTDHGLEVSGHTWEESLHASAAFVGDHFKVQRALGLPGVDSLYEWGRFPRHFKEAASVAHARGLPLVVENQAVQGAHDFASLQKAKDVTQLIGVWGGSVFVPGTFRSSRDRDDFPEQWFATQPWWPLFHHYADLAARISYMGTRGAHTCEIALYYPIESVWANGAPVFDEDQWGYSYASFDQHRGPSIRWGNVVDELDDVYSRIIDELPAARRDLDVLDSRYLQEAEIADGRLRLGDETFSVLVLPPMTCMRRAAAEQARRFHDAGGIVVAVGQLPSDSPEAGRNDQVLQDLLAPVTCVSDVESLIAHLHGRVPCDYELLAGEPGTLKHQRRTCGDQSAFLFVNDGETPCDAKVLLPAHGAVAGWYPATGERHAVPSVDTEDGVVATLGLEPGEALYVVVDPGASTDVPGDDRTGRRMGPVVAAEETLVAGPWTVRLDEAEVPMPYAHMRLTRRGEGRALGFDSPPYNEAFWELQWLSGEDETLRDWWVVGPWDYDVHRGYNREFPPELEVDTDAVYDVSGRALRWSRWTSTERVVNLDKALGLASEWGVIERWKTAYAFTRVWSPARYENAQLRVAADSNFKGWCNGRLVAAGREDNVGYVELRDAFGESGSFVLEAGWNSVLLKVSQGLRYAGFLGFVARICDAAGDPIEGVFASAGAEDAPISAEPMERWYRVRLPRGATSVRVPAAVAGECDTYLDGHAVSHDEGVVATGGKGEVLAIRMDASRRLHAPLTFTMGSFEAPLGSWSHTPLSYHSGEWIYERTLEIPPEWVGAPVVLDLGAVGVAARVEINGRPVADLPWAPFRVDITGAVRSGRNAVRVRVLNTNAQVRARGQADDPDALPVVRGRRLLDTAELNGLLGPVRLMRLPAHP